MIMYCVRYEDVTGPVDHLVAYYRDHHVPILLRWPGVRAVQLLTPIAAVDPQPTNPGTAALQVLITFDTQHDLQRALDSAERAEARDDFARFPAFAGRVTHQALRCDILSGDGP